MRPGVTMTGDPDLDALRRLLADLLEAGLRAVDAGAAVERSLGRDPFVGGADGLDVLAVGKAAGPMFAAARRYLGSRGSEPRRALVIEPAGGADSGAAGEVRLAASHPIPDERSVRAAEAALAMVSSAPPDRDLLVLLSGGASALMCAPVDGVSLELKQRITRHLMRAGADIRELNTVRKHLSKVKGGQLLRAFTGRAVRVLVVSDVPGDDLSLIGSGPFAPDPSTFAGAIGILRRRCREHSGDLAPVMAHLAYGAAGHAPGTLRPDEPAVLKVSHHVVASVRVALDAVALEAGRHGVPVVDLGDGLTGEAREVPARLAAELAGRSGPLVVLWGGETTVTVRGDGLGGRNQELALAAVGELAPGGSGVPAERWALAAFGTDGIDGPTPVGGALADSGSAARAAARGLDPSAFLARSDSYHFFEALGDLLVTGPTGTNVGDLLLFVRE